MTYLNNKLQNTPVINTAPTDGYVLTYDGVDGYWNPEPPASGGTSGPAAGDLSGTYPNPTVAKLQTVPVSATIPTNGQVLTYSSGSSEWEPQAAGAGSAAVIFDGTTSPENLRSNRATTQSTIDNTQIGIVNLSSDSAGGNPGANASYTTISGGDQNNAESPYSTVGGGSNNTAASYYSYSTISGGYNNTINDAYGFIGGGQSNGINGPNSVVSGGQSNFANGQYITIGGGESNSANAQFSTISGGTLNTVFGDYSVVGGGNTNNIYGNYAVVSGGLNNQANGTLSAVGGGNNNVATADVSIASGYFTGTNKYGQYAHSSSNINNTVGNCQYTRVVYSADDNNATGTPLTDTVGGEYTLEYNKQYAMKVTVIASYTAGSFFGDGGAMWVYDVYVSVDNGTAQVIATNLNFSYNNNAFGGIVFSINGLSLRMTFTGIVSNVVRAAATVESTELIFA